MLATRLSESDVVQILGSPEVREALGDVFGAAPMVRSMSSRRADMFTISGPGGEFVVRFPADESRLVGLRREERIQRGLAPFVSTTAIRLPEVRVVVASDALPIFAVHATIHGRDWFGYRYAHLSGHARARLATDLASFLLAVHEVPLPLAREWNTLVYRETDHGEAEYGRSVGLGKPNWFMPARVDGIRRKLGPYADRFVANALEETAAQFAALTVSPDDLVFGHGDLHGGNTVLRDDEVGPKLVGVLDLEAAGVMDVNYDFGRLNLIDDDVQARTIAEYQARSGRLLNLARIDVYSRAFILYLMGEQVDAEGKMSDVSSANYLKLVEPLRRRAKLS
jgi:aminoglycoside phosphotransferase (APT) family kinase protein